MIRNLFLSGAAAALAVAPLAAQAAPPRVSAPVSAEEEDLRGRSIVLPIVIAIGLAIVLYMAIDSEDDLDIPFSP